MDVAQFEALLMHEPESLLVIDVREDEEIRIHPFFEDDHDLPIIAFPLSELSALSAPEVTSYITSEATKKGVNPKDRLIVAVCRSGGRSRQAVSILEEQGFDCENLEGGYIEFTGLSY